MLLGLSVYFRTGKVLWLVLMLGSLFSDFLGNYPVRPLWNACGTSYGFRRALVMNLRAVLCGMGLSGTYTEMPR